MDKKGKQDSWDGTEKMRKEKNCERERERERER